MSALAKIQFLSSHFIHFKSKDKFLNNKVGFLVEEVLKYRHTKFPDALLKETLSWRSDRLGSKGKFDLIKNTKLALKEIMKVDKSELHIELDKYLTDLLTERDKIITNKTKASS